MAFVIVNPQTNPVAVTTNDTVVVWVEQNAVNLCAVTGCSSGFTLTPQLIASPVVGGVAMDSASAYWLSDGGGTAYKCPLTGCLETASVYSTDKTGSTYDQIAVNTNGVFLGDKFSVTWKGSGSPDVVASALDDFATPFAVDNTGVYVSMGGQNPGTFYCAYSSCPSFNQNAPPFLSIMGQLAASDGVVYIWSGSSISSCPNTGCSNLPAKVTTSAGSISSLAVDSSGVYWTTSDSSNPGSGTVQMCALPSCAGGPIVLASKQVNPISIAVSAHYVVWANQGASGMPGAIMGWAK